MAERNGDVVLAFLLGGIIGAAVGILYAPRSGKDTRKRLQDIGSDLTDKIEDFAGNVKEKAEHLAEETKEKMVSQKERLESAFEAGKKAYERKQP